MMSGRRGMPHVVVVGAGLAGLAAATVAARRGAEEVTVFERSHRAGGRATSRHIRGFLFNLGPHALYPTSQRLLRELGVSVPGGQPPLTGYALADGQLHPMPTGPLGLVGGALFTDDERAVVQSAFKNLGVDPPNSLAGVSLAAWLDRHGFRGRPRQFILALARLATYVDAPERFAAQAAFGQMQDAGGGVIYPDGGWQTLVAGLQTAALESGVKLVAAAPVRSIATSTSGFLVSLADGTIIPCDRVVVALDADATRRLLPPTLTARVLPNPGDAVRMASLDLGLSGLPNIDRGFVLALDRPLYLSMHSLAAKLAPEGGAAVSVARYLRPGEDVRPAQSLQELEEFMDLVQPGWRALEVARQFLPSMTVSSSFPAASAGGIAERPGPGALGIPGLFLAGDWVGNEGQLSAASLSSGITAGQLATAIGGGRDRP